jgi:hypothetical protein
VMMEYRFEVVGSFSADKLSQRATNKANELSTDGWKLVMWKLGFLDAALFLEFEREKKAEPVN